MTSGVTPNRCRTPGALQAYSKAIELHRTAQGRGGEPLLPARLVNNAAVLHMRAGNTREASSLMQAALASVAANSSQPAAASMQVGRTSSGASGPQPGLPARACGLLTGRWGRDAHLHLGACKRLLRADRLLAPPALCR